MRTVPKGIAPARETIGTAQRALQEAGTALGREDYPEAQRIVTGHAARVRAAIQQIDAVLATSVSKAPRKRR
jgi:hypothetical protein